MSKLAIGIDVHGNRDCPYAVVDETARMVTGGWIPISKVRDGVLDLAYQYQDAVFAIDAPRMPLSKPRMWYWRNNKWSRRKSGEKGFGRHCEVVIAVHRLATPQWTPLAEAAPGWMQNGFDIYSALKGAADCLEVFPSASYRMFGDAGTTRSDIDLTKFYTDPKDMLDAVVAAITAMEFLLGRGQEVGGGDGFGSIILPRTISAPIPDVMRWPDNK